MPGPDVVLAPEQALEWDETRDWDMVHIIDDESTGLTLCGLVLGEDFNDFGEDVDPDCVVCAAMEEDACG